MKRPFGIDDHLKTAQNCIAYNCLLFLLFALFLVPTQHTQRSRGSHDYYAVPGSGLHACFLARGTAGRVTEAVGKVSLRVTTLFPLFL